MTKIDETVSFPEIPSGARSYFDLSEGEQRNTYILLSKIAGLVPDHSEDDDWSNVLEHEKAVARVAVALANLLDCPEQHKTELRQAAFVHDIWKRNQRKLMDHYKKDREEGGEKGVEIAAKQQNQFLKLGGFSDKVIALTNSVGHAALERLVKDPKSQKLELKDHIPLRILIMHYADTITWETEIVSVNKRIDALENRDSPYPEATQGGDIFGGKTYYKVQREVGHLIEQHFCQLLEDRGQEVPDNPAQLPEFINGKIAADAALV